MGQGVIAPDHQKAGKLNMPRAEACLKLVGTFHVVELLKPIEDLTEPALDPRRPFRRRLLALLTKKTTGQGVFPFHEDEGLLNGIADHEVARVIAEQLVLEGEKIRAGDAPGETADVERQLLVC